MKSSIYKILESVLTIIFLCDSKKIKIKDNSNVKVIKYIMFNGIGKLRIYM